MQISHHLFVVDDVRGFREDLLNRRLVICQRARARTQRGKSQTRENAQSPKRAQDCKTAAFFIHFLTEQAEAEAARAPRVVVHHNRRLDHVAVLGEILFQQ